MSGIGAKNVAEYEQNWTKYHKTFVSGVDPNQPVKSSDRFTKNADCYEETILKLNYKAPEYVAQAALRLVDNHSKNTKILDVACGTGLVGKELRKIGFKGIIDGSDGSEGMLKHAEKSDIYRELECHILSKENPLKNEDNMYDAVVCCGSIGIGKINYDCLNELLRVGKPGSLIIITMQPPGKNCCFNKSLYAEIDRLIKEGAWKESEIIAINYFQHVENGQPVQDDHAYPASVRCYIKC